MSSSSTASVLSLLADLVRINSVNPNYEGGVPEVELANFVQRYFQQRQIETWRQEVYPQRPNIIARVPGRDASRRIVFEAHLDTVSTAGMSIPPWEPEIRDGRMYGRGACDTKGGMAAMMHALANLSEEAVPPPCDVLFAATIDEEYSYRGVVALCESLPPEAQPLRADAAIVAEPTDLRAVIASKGLVRWKIETIGRAAHSAKPHLGVNAIEAMARVVAALEADTREMATRTHPLLGAATCNVGVIRGGVQINFVPDRCEIEIDRRLLPGETPESALVHYQTLVDELTGQDPELKVVMHEPMLTDVPLETDADCQAVRTMRQVLETIGLDDTPLGVPFCSDASKFGARGIPSIILGPGSIDQAHAAVEYVDVYQVEQAAEVYRRFMLTFDPTAEE